MAEPSDNPVSPEEQPQPQQDSAAAEAGDADAPAREESPGVQPESPAEPDADVSDGPAAETDGNEPQSVDDQPDADSTAPAAEQPEQTPFNLEEFGPASGQQSGRAGMGLLSDVALNVKIELGRTRMYVEDVLRLNPNSVVELDKAAGDPVDIYVNDRHVARGEVLVVNENFCVRVSEILHSVTDKVDDEDDEDEASAAGGTQAA